MSGSGNHHPVYRHLPSSSSRLSQLHDRYQQKHEVPTHTPVQSSLPTASSYRVTSYLGSQNAHSFEICKNKDVESGGKRRQPEYVSFSYETDTEQFGSQGSYGQGKEHVARYNTGHYTEIRPATASYSGWNEKASNGYKHNEGAHERGNLFKIPKIPSNVLYDSEERISKVTKEDLSVKRHKKHTSDYGDTSVIMKTAEKPGKSTDSEETESADESDNYDVNAGIPRELFNKFHPLRCELCDAVMNSTPQAKMHYDGKQHQKKIRMYILNWKPGIEDKNVALKRKALDPPIKEADKPVESNHMYCGLCDVHFTCEQNAQQHFIGKAHKRAETTGVAKSRLRKAGEDIDSPSAAKQSKFYCELCDCGTTSKDQLETHFKGTKHAKSIKANPGRASELRREWELQYNMPEEDPFLDDFGVDFRKPRHLKSTDYDDEEDDDEEEEYDDENDITKYRTPSEVPRWKI